MSSKIVLNSKTKENFNIVVRKVNINCESFLTHPHWNCGYIHIPIQNAKFINSDTLYVHGDVTYQEQDQKYYTIGFDCAHYCDSPEFIKRPRSIGYCKNELIHLSKQIKKQIINGKRRMIKNRIKEIKGKI